MGMRIPMFYATMINTTTAVARNVILSDRRERRISLLRCTSNRKNEILRRFSRFASFAPQNDKVRL